MRTPWAAGGPLTRLGPAHGEEAPLILAPLPPPPCLLAPVGRLASIVER
jgi:hypothetical protein